MKGRKMGHKYVDLALEIAKKAHCHQVDKSGKPYIEHPKAVAEMLTDLEDKIVAYLHDVVEDTSWTLEMIKDQGYPDYIIHSISLLTKKKNERNTTYINRLKSDPRAVRVKIADLKHNLSPERMQTLDKETQTRLKKKYMEGLEQLGVTLIKSRRSSNF